MFYAFPQRELPESLRLLAELASDSFWSWSHAGDELWRSLDPEKWELTENPWIILQDISSERLDELSRDSKLCEELQRVAEERQQYLSQPTWYEQEHAGADMGVIAYFCMEFGLGNALPLYAGGLGILAGDYLKAASDLGVPVVGVGLLYQEGYFRQFIDANRRQQEVYTYNDPTSLAIQPVMATAGNWLRVSVALPGRELSLRVWQTQIGRVTLYLLDSNDPINSPIDRGITGKLYGGGQELRFLQEIVLGIGGFRALTAMGLNVDVCHLNEGHTAFVVLERARSCIEKTGLSFREALWATRAGNVFTTHTPVAAGFDAFPAALVEEYFPFFGDYLGKLGLSLDEFLGLGRNDPKNASEPFNMAYLALRGCSFVNGVSQLHGTVSRRIFQPLFPGWPVDEIPVGHVTNGIHVPSWDSAWADALWTESCGKGRWLDAMENLCDAINCVDDKELLTFRTRQRSRLIDSTRFRLARHLGQRGERPEIVEQVSQFLDPNVLTLCFARRFAEYKRPNLLLVDPDRLLRLLNDPGHPIQIIVAGKAHPADETGKRMLTEWIDFAMRPDARGRIVFLEDYDMAVAQDLVQGADVWINTPRRPWEACGTSGMKVLVNGGLNLSVLDGWWAEAYSPELGWALGNGEEIPDPGHDAVDAQELYRLLEEEVIPEFYDRDQEGIPRKWVAQMRKSMGTLAPHFSSNRMVREYLEQYYIPAAGTIRRRQEKDALLARELSAWQIRLEKHWEHLRFGEMDIHMGEGCWKFEIQVYLGEIAPEWVQVQLYAEPANGEPAVCQIMERGLDITGSVNGYRYSATVSAARPAEHYTARIVPYHPEASVPTEINLVKWQR